MIEIENLVKRYGALTAVDGVSFVVKPGEVLGFLGPNGAGKSTTMKVITGFLAPTEGVVRVCGFDVADRPLEAKRRIGYLPEGAPAYPDMTPRAFLSFIADVRGLTGPRRREMIDQAVERVAINRVMDQQIDTLSKGFKRRVGLAQAILHEPQVMILDEPTDGLDPNQKHEVRRLIRSLSAERTIVISTHILEEVDALCSRAIIIDRGRVVADGTPASLEAMSTIHNAVVLQLATPVPGAADALRRLAHVAGVEERLPNLSFLVSPRDGSPIVAEVGELARLNGWPIDRIYVEPGRLDEVFRRLTTGDQDLAAPADAA
ncbi:ABC transporter ATP-binding protein [Zavarzinia sp. CC-PAN008]|uniref:ABC transporter ATP-binding protein n=1 Tax=Zavarzinia sp. CC-PAN008 TaxID=3243332 RepID=UPI003F74A30F